MRLFDSHVHLDDSKYDPDRHSIIEDLGKNDIAKVICVGADIQTSLQCVALADSNEQIYASVGVHPHDAKDFVDKNIETLTTLAAHQKVVAIGEIGLDYHYDSSPRDIQMEVLLRQLQLAKTLDLPVIYHIREAFGDFLPMVRSGDAIGTAVMHCYSGSIESARVCLDAGMMISFTGVVTFKNAHKVREVVEYIPLDRLLIETDCPYMSPEPYRGKRNQPAYVRYVAEMIAKIKGLTVEEIADITYNNTLSLFKIALPSRGI